jgi:hypothetical protein
MSQDYLDWIRTGVSRFVIETPPELPVSERDPSLYQNSEVITGRDPRFMCMPNACIFNLDADPSELNPTPTNYAELVKIGWGLAQSLSEGYIPPLDSGMCEPGWYSLPTLDVTDPLAAKAAKDCGMLVPWLPVPGKPKMGCQTLF